MSSTGSGAGALVAALPEALAEVDGVLAGLTATVGDQVDALGHSELGPVLVALRQVQARCDALILAVVGEVDARGTFTLDGAITTAAWVRATIHPTPAAAHRLSRTARALRAGDLPNTSAALAAGAIGASHAGVITDGVHDAPAGAVALVEAEIVALAGETDEAGTAHLMRAFTHALDPDAADQRAIRRYERAGITLATTLDGGFHLHGSTDETTGALILDAINHAAPPVRGDTRTAARRRLDALADICRHWLDHPDTVAAGPTGRRRTQLIVTTDPSTLTTEAAEADTTDAGNGSPGATLSWAGWITAATARRAGCDAHTTTLTLDTHGEVVETGTHRRFFTPAQRRAIIGRDGDRCPAPYCDRPITWSDAHHLHPTSAGGATTITNGALPCEAHHLMLHEGHWQLHRQPDGRYTLHNPRTGVALGPEPHPPGHNRPAGHRRQ